MSPKTRYVDYPPDSPPASPDLGFPQSSVSPTPATLALVLKQMALINARMDAQSADAPAAIVVAPADPSSAVRRRDAQLDPLRDIHSLSLLASAPPHTRIYLSRRSIGRADGPRCCCRCSFGWRPPCRTPPPRREQRTTASRTARGTPTTTSSVPSCMVCPPGSRTFLPGSTAAPRPVATRTRTARRIQWPATLLSPADHLLPSPVDHRLPSMAGIRILHRVVGTPPVAAVAPPLTRWSSAARPTRPPVSTRTPSTGP
jgi:hypothetical protein